MTDPDLPLLEKYLAKQCSPEENFEVETWMRKNELSAEQLKQILMPPPELALLTRLSPEKDWEQVRQKISLRPQKIHWLGWPRVAAAVLLTMVATYLYVGDPFHFREPLSYTFNCDQDAIKRVVLPDSSVVHLRKGSMVTYLETFAIRRQVTMKGEVTFEVRRDSTNEFIVTIGQAHVRVLGTSFHILDRKEQLDVNVTKGKVSFEPSKQAQAILQQGEHGSYIKTSHQLLKASIKDLNFQAWKTRELKFQDAPLETVAKDIGDYFNVSTRLQGDRSLRYTSSFRNPTLKEVLDEMKNVLGVKYELNARSVTIVAEER